jgi:hypothetical protein
MQPILVHRLQLRNYDRLFVTNTANSIPLFFYLVCEAIGTAATPGLLCQPRVIMKMILEKQMECRLQGKPMVSEKTCPSATFVRHKIPHDRPGFEPGPPRWEAGD